MTDHPEATRLSPSNKRRLMRRKPTDHRRRQAFLELLEPRHLLTGPELFAIRPDELATRPSALEFWRGSWNEAAWGEQRITIHPRHQTATLGRGGFFIHGGTTWGSAGCIDLTYGMASFSKVIGALAGCHIPMTVNYRGTTLVPMP